jgi:hypothetical protein
MHVQQKAGARLLASLHSLTGESRWSYPLAWLQKLLALYRTNQHEPDVPARVLAGAGASGSCAADSRTVI